MNCQYCGLPIFEGSSGYVGAQCLCVFRPVKEQTNNELLRECIKLKSQMDRLLDALKEVMSHTRHPDYDLHQSTINEITALIQEIEQESKE